jgi:uncharacterized protein YndB with AHSA1/START domain
MQKITVTAVIDADADTVWACWTTPDHIIKWNHASDDWHCPRVTNDLRVGGKYTARMEARDGSFGFDFDVVYNEVRLGERLAYTMLDGRAAVVDFEDLGDKARVTTTFDAEDQNDPEMQRAGWQSILYNFKKYVEAR